jgi:hypothetical protein
LYSFLNTIRVATFRRESKAEPATGMGEKKKKMYV